ncbi:ABC transporter ATP-binding protein [Lacticaseibacillus brantae]|uniref:Abc transporter, atp-binding protein n=1 Tax=Lacticaseibacillus brantae DSM 23927 TaxID=1423727 RepID=A0A0R2AWB1_9LACO|nr:ATP-binding cassette domain-containing protein [Lacticaseibacillus brantae]KRM71280.1 abc transporter, atp-binding protein [Lacticaseibacillus brantae DSM 23927]
MTALFTLTDIDFATTERQILHHINLTVDAGDSLTITGPSGSGKSTLLRIMATLLTATNGQIAYNGRPLSEYDPFAYRKEVSYCFQQASLFGDTVYDNLSFPYVIRNQAFDETHALEALSQVELGPDNLHKPITELSGGEKQRVALVRNVLFTPKVLLLDEVTTGLDADTKTIVHHFIDHLNQHHDVTLIAVTHDETEINTANHLITLADGQLEVTA